MKKLFITAFAAIILIAVAITFGFGQFGLKVDPKKAACEKACGAAYDKCKSEAEDTIFKKCMEEAGTIEDANKKSAAELGCNATKEASLLACQKAKDECNSRCN